VPQDIFGKGNSQQHIQHKSVISNIVGTGGTQPVPFFGRKKGSDDFGQTDQSMDEAAAFRAGLRANAGVQLHAMGALGDVRESYNKKQWVD